MRRSRGVVAFAVLFVLTACGGTDWNATQGPGGKPVPSSQSAQAAKQQKAHVASELAAERPYVDALVVSAQANDDGKPGLSAASYRCIASAIVHGYGANTFASSGLTPNALRSPDSTLDALPDPSDDQIAAIGAALQHCNINLVAIALATAVGAEDQGTVACLAGHLGRGDDAHRFLVLSALDRHVDLAAAHNVVGIIAACVDLASVVLRAGHVVTDAGTRACLVDALHGTDAALKDYFALKISDADPETARQAFEDIGVAINHCRPDANTGFTVPSG